MLDTSYKRPIIDIPRIVNDSKPALSGTQYALSFRVPFEEFVTDIPSYQSSLDSAAVRIFPDAAKCKR